MRASTLRLWRAKKEISLQVRSTSFQMISRISLQPKAADQSSALMEESLGLRMVLRFSGLGTRTQSSFPHARLRERMNSSRNLR